MRHWLFFGMSLSAGLVVAAGAAAAADPAALLKRALACRGVESADARLACYDEALSDADPAALETAAAAPTAAPAAPPAPVAASAPAAAAAPEHRLTPEETFGATAAMIEKKRGKPKNELDSITSAVVELDKSAAGDLIVRLANGQVWLQKGTERAPFLNKDPDEYSVTIRRSPFGGYRMRIEPIGRTIRVRRIK